jgi:hypothetical protein
LPCLLVDEKKHTRLGQPSVKGYDGVMENEDSTDSVWILEELAHDKNAHVARAQRIEDSEITPAVVKARLAGASWQVIGLALGVDKDTAQYRYQAAARAAGDTNYRVKRCKLPLVDGGYCRKGIAVTVVSTQGQRMEVCKDHALVSLSRGAKLADDEQSANGVD